MEDKLLTTNNGEEKNIYEAPRIIQKREIIIELQTNYIPDEPPPPM